MKKYFKVCLNGYDEYYSCDEFQDKKSLLEYFEENEIKNWGKPVSKDNITLVETDKISEIEYAYTENNNVLNLDCLCAESFSYLSNTDSEYNGLINEYEQNERAMFLCPSCGKLCIVKEIEQDPYRGRC